MSDRRASAFPRIVARQTKGMYVIQELIENSTKAEISGSLFPAPTGRWVTIEECPEHFILREAERRLKEFRESFDKTNDYRLVFKRTEVTYELEIGAHEEV